MMQQIEVSNRTVIRILVIIFGFWASIYLAFIVRQQLTWIFTAIFLAVALDPMVEGLSKYLPRKSRGLAVLAVFLVAIGVIAFVAAALVPPLVTQSQDFAKSIPGHLSSIGNSHGWLGDQLRRYKLVDRIRSELGSVGNSLTTATSSVLGFIGSIFGNILSGLTVLVLTFFMLIEGPTWIKRFWSYYNGRHRDLYQSLTAQMYNAVSGYVLGNLLTSIICSAATGLVLVILGIPYAIPIAILVGILDLLPLVGASLGAIVAVGVAAFHSITTGIILLIFFVIYQQIENNILQPYVYGKTVQMSPLAVFLSAIIGASLGGILGALVAVPVGASLQILIKAYLQEKF